MTEELGYEDVASMRGGITLWKDRGYEVEVPRALSGEQRERYSRHLLVPEIGLEGQLKLLDARVLLLGAGGLGSPAALYLAAAGEPSPPAPSRSTLASRSFICPSRPISGIRMWRE